MDVYVQGTSDHDWPILTENADRIFRTISHFPEPIDWTQSIRNLRIEQKRLRNFFKDRYSARLALKMVNLFDFSMAVDYRAFYK